MRRRRIAFFSLTVIALLVLFYTGDPIYLWVVIFQLSMLVISLLNILITFMSIRFLQSATPESAVKGDSVRLQLELHNESFFPFAHLTLRYSTPETLYTGEECHLSTLLLPRKSEVLSVPIKCPYRGLYQLGFTQLEATDIFGLITITVPFTVYHNKPVDLLVYPQVREIAPGSLVNREMEGTKDTTQTRSEELSSIAEIRDYREGDPLKRIHWKLSARHKKFLIKEFDGSLVTDSLILVDCTEHRLEGEEAAQFEDTVAECAATFCKRMTDDYQSITMITYADSRTELSGASPVDFPAFRELLARIKFCGDLSISSAVKLERTLMGNIGSLIVITRSPTDELFEMLVYLSENDCRITLVSVLKDNTPDENLIRMFGELSLRGIRALSLIPGEDISLQLGGGNQ